MTENGSYYTLDITERCNFRCRYCFAPPGYVDGKGREESLEAVKARLETLAREGYAEVSLTGGEPTTHPGLREIVASAESLGLRVVVNTNGLRFADPQYLDSFRGSWFRCLVSFPSHREEVYNHLTRTECFPRAVAAIHALLRAGVPVSLSHVLNRQNHADFPDWVDYVSKNFFAVGAYQGHMGSVNLFYNQDVDGDDHCLVPFTRVRPFLFEGLKRAGFPIEYKTSCTVSECLLEERFLDHAENFSPATREENLAKLAALPFQPQRDLSNYFVPERCCSCARFLNPSCKGIRKNYLLAFGAEEFGALLDAAEKRQVGKRELRTCPYITLGLTGAAATAAVSGLAQTVRSASDPQARLEAIRILGCMGPEARAALAVLAGTVRDPDPEVSREASALVRQMKPDAGEIDGLAPSHRPFDSAQGRREGRGVARPGEMEKRLRLARRLAGKGSWSHTSVFLYPPQEAWTPIRPSRIRNSWRSTGKWCQAPFPKWGLYLSIPAEAAVPGVAEGYLRCLGKETELLQLPEGPFRTLYIGSGGEGALARLSAAQIEKLFRWLRGRFRLDGLSQAVAEVDPLQMSADKAALLASHGITRVSMTLPHDTLHPAPPPMNRRRESFLAAFAVCRERGIRQIDVDLPAGLEGQEAAGFRRDLDRVLKLDPDSMHLRVWSGAPPESLAEMLGIAGERLTPAGPAENLQLRHHTEGGASVLGIGFGAISRVCTRLIYSTAGPLPGYLKALARGVPPPYLGFPLTRTREMRAHLIRSLEELGRVESGEFQAVFGEGPEGAFGGEFEWLLERGWLERKGGVLQVIPERMEERALISRLFYEGKLLRRLAGGAA